MKFISVRDLRSKSAQVWNQLPQEREMIITSNGRPIAIIAAISDSNLEESLSAFRQARAVGAVASLQRRSVVTPAQERALTEIKEDLEKPHPMNRLIQGDVGCGKTVVALLTCLYVVECGDQAAIMAPTEVLAEQHFLNLHRWLESLGVKVVLLTSSIKGSEREELYQRIRNGEIQLMIGTHAVIQEAVEFRRLGLAIIDEQHKFGVVPKRAFEKEGRKSDVLVMTATPIPRTLAMTIYGDLDVSLIDEMPPGRMSVETKVYPESARSRVYRTIEEEVGKGRQAFIVYPRSRLHRPRVEPGGFWRTPRRCSPPRPGWR